MTCVLTVWNDDRDLKQFLSGMTRGDDDDGGENVGSTDIDHVAFTYLYSSSSLEFFLGWYFLDRFLRGIENNVSYV